MTVAQKPTVGQKLKKGFDFFLMSLGISVYAKKKPMPARPQPTPGRTPPTGRAGPTGPIER